MPSPLQEIHHYSTPINIPHISLESLTGIDNALQVNQGTTALYVTAVKTACAPVDDLLVSCT